MSETKRARKGETQQKEAAKILKDFQVEGSKGLDFLETIGMQNSSVKALVSIADTLCVHAAISTVKPVYKRSRELMMKWFTDNYNKILPYAGYVSQIKH